MQKENKAYTRFPTSGELIDFFMKVLEIEYTNDADRKRYQRFVNEENITIDEYNEVLAYCIDAILDELFDDDLKIEVSKKFIDDFLEYYLKVVREVEVYPYAQECIDYILVQYLYLPFLWFFHQHFMKIDISMFSSSDKVPLVDIFNLLEKENKEKFLFTELDNITDNEKTDKTLHQNLFNWLTNKNYPNREHIEYLSKIFSEHFNRKEEEIKQVFFIGKLINLTNGMLEKEQIFKPNNFQNIEKLIGEMCEPKFSDISYLGYQLALSSDIHTKKTDSMIEEFNKLYIKIKNQGYIPENMPYLALSKARFHAQQKEFKEATKYYLLALKNGKNSMGKYYLFIMKEGLIVSAQITREKSLTLDSAKSHFVKFYKEAYFSKTIDSLPSEISPFFLNDMKKKFSLYFKCLYPNISSTKGIFKAHEQGIIYTPDIENIKLDLAKPNKRIKNKYPNPMSQLMHFAFLLKYDEVKKLLKAGANPNEMRFNDNGTALTMILSNEYHDEKRKEAIKISQLLIFKMSKEALNAKLPKKRMTALSMSIELGYVDIVKLLIEKGAEVNQVIDMNDVSPLYYTLLQIHFSKGDNFKKGMKNYKDLTDRQILNRKNNLNDALSPIHFKDCITDEEKTNRYQEMCNSHKGNPSNDLIEERYLEIESEKYKKNTNNYYKIFDLILDCNPQLETYILETGHTVLILATELNEIEIVKKLLEKGANKDAKTKNGHRAIDYAKRNFNLELIELLK